MRSLRIFLLLLSLGCGHAGTVVTLGNIAQFTGPDDPNLDLVGNFDYAVNFSANDPVRTVKGLAFKPDTQVIPGASFLGPQNVTPWQTKPEFGSSADANELEEIMQDIRWAVSPGEKLQATLAVTPGILYKIQVLFSANNGGENRRWDIRINGQNAVDEITSFGHSTGASYSINRATVWSYEFTPTATPITVEMGQLFGANDGGDRNPIWQALTLERVYVPPFPDDLTLAPTQFFPAQSAFIGNFVVTDGKFAATHNLTFVAGAGATDNAKFSISGKQLLPAPFDFSSQSAGTNYSVRVRATDAEDGARFIEKSFTIGLAAPHAPTAVGLNASSISSGLLAGYFAGKLVATDADSFDRHSFQLVAGPGSGDNGFFTVVGDELRIASVLPPGTTSVSLRLRATDLAGLMVETALTLPVTDPALRINEVLSVSTAASLPLDQESKPQDWIELYNEQSQPVSLQGWHLTDDPALPSKWSLPNVVIPPNGYYLIFASGSGATFASGPPHTNFSLSQKGEHLILSRADGVVVSDFNPPEQFPNKTWGVEGGGTESGYLRTPTPGALNSQLALAGRNDVLFSVPHGHMTAAFPLTLTATVPDSVIHYTLDGSLPTLASPVFSVPITITPTAGTTQSGTRIVRAFAAHPDAAYTPVTTQTYLFVNGVVNPNTDGVIAQSNLIASIKNHPTYGPLIDDAILALPTVSVVINVAGDLPYAETESSVELFDPQNGEPGFTIPAGIARSGTTSLGYPKGSMSARFRGEYGQPKLIYPVFGRHPHDPLGATNEFQELRLRSGSHDTHSWLGTAENPPVPYGSPSVYRSGDAQLVRNIWIEDMQLLMGQPGKHGRMVQMFVNGNYYGIYHIQEHADDDYMGSYFPGGSDDYHYTGGGTTGSVHGSESWSQIWAQMKASLTNYNEARRWVDVTNLADYMILSFYAGNDWDWSTQHNWGAAGPRLPDWGGWKFFSQDQDLCLQDLNANCTDQNVPDGVFTSLMAFPDFKVLFRDRVYKHFFHDGVLTPAKAGGYYSLRTTEINTAIVAETARWQPTSSVGPLPWDRDGEWSVERNYMLNTYFPGRTTVQLNQFKANPGWYPVDAPEMSQWGGAIAPGTEVTLTGPANSVIYYTTDGSDPRLPGGAVNPAASIYRLGSLDVLLIQPYDKIANQGATWKYLVPTSDPGPAWKTNAYVDTAWPQGRVELGFGQPFTVTTIPKVDTNPNLAGNQFNLTSYFRHTFNVADPSVVSALKIRIKRDDGAVVYLNGQEIYRVSMPAGAIGFTTPGNNGVSVTDDGQTWISQTIESGQFTLNAGSNVMAIEVHNSTAFDLDLTLDFELKATMAPSHQFITSATTLKARALAGTEWSAVNEASFYLTGTQPASTANLTLSEIHYHPEGTGQGDAEFLEFKNTGSNPVDMTGVQIGGAVVYTFPSGIVLLPGEHVVVVKNLSLFDARYRTVGSPWYHAGIRVAGAWSGSLANGGESIIVLAANDAPIYTFSYGDAGAWPGRADGGGSSLELSNPLSAPTTLPDKAAYLGAPQNWRPSSEFHGTPGYAGTGPDNRIVINELLSSSVPPATDFIELLNISGVSQSVGGWFLSDSSSDYRKFKIPTGTSLAPGAYLVFNESHFNNPANPASLVPFSLNSSGDDVFLVQADSAGNLLKFADRVEFSSTPGDMTYGRAPDGTGAFALLRSNSPGAANAAAIPEYAAWVAAKFPANAPGTTTALSADPDFDGLNNLLEFAFKLDPLIPNGSPVSVAASTGGSPLEITYKLRHDVPGLTARVDVSDDLEIWDITESRIELLSQPPQPDGTTIYNARLTPLPASNRTFMRITIGL